MYVILSKCKIDIYNSHGHLEKSFLLLLTRFFFVNIPPHNDQYGEK